MALPGDAVAASVAPPRAAPGSSAPARARRRARWRAASAPRHIGPAGTGGYVLARPRARAFARALGRRDLLVYAAARHAGRAAPARGRPGPAVGAAGRLARLDRRPGADAPGGRRQQPADRARRRPARQDAPRVGRRQHRRDRAVPAHQLARHRHRLGGGRAGQRRSGSSASGRERARSTCRCRTRSPARRSADQIGVAIERGAAVINMSYGVARALLPGVRRAPGRGRQRDRARRRRRQRVRRGQPARVPGLAAARPHGRRRRRRRRPSRARSSRTPTPRSTSRRRARRS